MIVTVGSVYRLRHTPDMGDYAGSIVVVETGPRNEGVALQYRVGWGTESWEVDWIDAVMFDGAELLEDFDDTALRYSSRKRPEVEIG